MKILAVITLFIVIFIGTAASSADVLASTASFGASATHHYSDLMVNRACEIDGCVLKAQSQNTKDDCVQHCIQRTAPRGNVIATLADSLFYPYVAVAALCILCAYFAAQKPLSRYLLYGFGNRFSLRFVTSTVLRN